MNIRYLLLDRVLDPGRKALRLVKRVQLWTSIYQFINKKMLALKKPVWRYKKDFPVQKFGLRRLQVIDAIQTKPPFLPLTQGIKRRLLS